MSAEPTELFDEVGYPSDEILAYIAKWEPAIEFDFKPLMDLIGRIWAYPDCFYADPYNRTYALLTAGWSGNEDIIQALRNNLLFWTMCWMSSHRGGKHVFVLPEVKVE